MEFGGNPKPEVVYLKTKTPIADIFPVPEIHLDE